MSVREKILILVKTYPTPSVKYVETVCTAGIREDGSWVRIFPVPFRSYDEYKKYKKYQWIECSVYKADKDKRKESFHLDTSHQMEIKDVIDASDSWNRRRMLVLGKARIFTRKAELLEASENKTASLAVFKPTAIKMLWEEAKVEPIEPKKLAKIRAQISQNDMFEENSWREDFKLAEQIPYDFKYEITDADGQVFKHKIIDWELGALFFKMFKSKGSKEVARDCVLKKYGEEFLDPKIDLHLYMGTMYKVQKWGVVNPWTIIGVAPFPRVNAVQPEFVF